MKRVICLCLALIIVFPMLSCQVQAEENRIHCRPGDTFYAVFALAEDSDQPDGVMGRLVFDTDLFAVMPVLDLIGADGFSILNRHPAVLQFKVSRFAPPGEYSIEAQVVEAADADGKKYTNVKIAPVRIIVESATGAAAESGKKQIAAGDYVTFGHYPQTAEGNDQTPIEWLVLEVRDNKALLLSKYGLDAKPYNTEWENVTWETCTLRNWLNQDFVKRAFSSTEQKAIITTTVDNSREKGYSVWTTDGGNNTKDKVFLLSYTEVNEYLNRQQTIISGSKDKIQSRVSPTEYARKQGAGIDYTYKTAEGNASGWWWLRSPGRDQNGAVYVENDGSRRYNFVHYTSGCVRPAMWVSLDVIGH